MDLSGMIFVALAVVWAVYLIPRAVNRSEDELASLPAEELEVAEGRSVPAAAPGSSRGPVTKHRRAVTGTERAAVRLAVARRRRVLLSLCGLTALTGVVSLVSPLPLWSVAVPGVLVLAWLAVCRVQVRRLEAARAARQVVRAHAAPAPVEADEADGATATDALDDTAATDAVDDTVAPRPAVREFRVEVPDSPAALVVEPDEDTVGLSPADREAALAEEMPRGAVWDPRPLTLPTYISKPRARRVPRTLALDGAGVSSSGRDARDSRLVSDDAAAGVEATARPREAVGS